MTHPSETSKSTKNTFWNSCPRKLQFFPDVQCYLGKQAVDAKNDDKGCSWHINSLEDNYCFWKWVRRVSDRDGFMPALLQSEISEMLGLSNSKINQYFKEAIDKIKELDEFEDLKDLF